MRIHYFRHNSRQRFARLRWPRRKVGHGPETRPAGLRLPPVVHHESPLAVSADHPVRPFKRFWIQRFASDGE